MKVLFVGETFWKSLRKPGKIGFFNTMPEDFGLRN